MYLKMKLLFLWAPAAVERQLAGEELRPTIVWLVVARLGGRIGGPDAWAGQEPKVGLQVETVRLGQTHSPSFCLAGEQHAALQ